ncbi:MAG: hypothetical protein ACPGZP_01145 [Panacagrimonas sp.]
MKSTWPLGAALSLIAWAATAQATEPTDADTAPTVVDTTNADGGTITVTGETNLYGANKASSATRLPLS